MSVLLFILILVVLILAHEFGHFIVAKAFGIRVDEFGIFFPPRIGALHYGETEYSLNWLPFGGFVKIFGENYDEGARDPRSFVNKNRFIQALVLVAGVTCNLLLAWLLLSAGYLVGLPTSVQHEGVGVVQNAHVMIVNVLPDSPAQKAGFVSGDIIKEVQTGSATEPSGDNATQVQQFIASHQEESVVVTVLRDTKEMTFLAKPAEGVVAGRKAIGVEFDDVGILKLSPPLALIEGAVLGWDITRTTAVGLTHFFAQIATGKADFTQVSGPVGITAFGAATIKQGFAATVVLVSLISINLAILNLLPIPGLDGGRLLIVIVEGIRRKPVPVRYLNFLTIGSFALLILLMLVVSYHDIVRLLR